MSSNWELKFRICSTIWYRRQAQIQADSSLGQNYVSFRQHGQYHNGYQGAGRKTGFRLKTEHRPWRVHAKTCNGVGASAIRYRHLFLDPHPPWPGTRMRGWHSGSCANTTQDAELAEAQRALINQHRIKTGREKATTTRHKAGSRETGREKEFRNSARDRRLWTSREYDSKTHLEADGLDRRDGKIYLALL